MTVVGVPAKIVKQLDNKKYYSEKEKNSSRSINRFQYGDGI